MEKGKGGGILRSEKNGGGSGGTTSRDHGHVSFSNNHVERTIPSRTQNNTATNNGGGGGYDSDDVEDSIMASGDTFAMGGDKRGHTNDDHEMNDASVKTLSEIEEAKRKRGRVRRREDEVEGSIHDFDKDDTKHYANNNDMSLITDQDKNPDEYETNAGINAEHPVEPFNMNAEKDGGLGYFDGDTYVFRHNQKPVDGEDDAWLDGLGEDNEKETGGGGLDSTSIWKPNTKEGDTKADGNKRKSKFVSEDDVPEDIGRRMATLLQDDNETVMMALTRHGASIRQLQSQQQKLAKKSKIKKRKSSKSKKEDDTASTTSTSSDNIDAEAKQLKMKVEQTRECVEELTELADALLFGGETEAYELTKSDWIHKFKLEQHFPSSSSAVAAQRKRPLEGLEDTQTKKKSKGYFDTNTEETKTETQVADNTNKPSIESTVMWEYKGNEDGTIHGPYTSQQMKDWTSCGYFVGESAVDIRRVGSSSDTGKSDNKQESKEEDTKADVDDLMADLMDDDEEETKEESENTSASWMRSDRVDFSLYI